MHGLLDENIQTTDKWRSNHVFHFHNLARPKKKKKKKKKVKKVTSCSGERTESKTHHMWVRRVCERCAREELQYRPKP
jgi:hypothetical protein